MFYFCCSLGFVVLGLPINCNIGGFLKKHTQKKKKTPKVKSKTTKVFIGKVIILGNNLE